MKKIQKMFQEANAFADNNTPDWKQKPTWEEVFSQKFEELLEQEIMTTTLDFKNDAHYAGWVEMREALVKKLLGEENVSSN